MSDRYWIVLSHGGFREVEGWPVVVEGWEWWDLFVHRAIEYGDCLDLWNVSDGMTGYAVIEGESSKDDAVWAIRLKLRERIPEHARASMAQAMAKTGVTPRHAPQPDRETEAA